MWKIFSIVYFIVAVSVFPAFAQEAPVVLRGTQGLVAVPFRLANASGRPVVCAAAIAHWYSAEIGRAAPGGHLEAELWSKPATGEVFLLNDRQDRMPVQRLWCGYEGADVSTRSDIALAHRAGTAEPAVDLICGAEGGAPGLACRRRGTP